MCCSVSAQSYRHLPCWTVKQPLLVCMLPFQPWRAAFPACACCPFSLSLLPFQPVLAAFPACACCPSSLCLLPFQPVLAAFPAYASKQALVPSFFCLCHFLFVSCNCVGRIDKHQVMAAIARLQVTWAHNKGWYADVQYACI